MDKPVTITKLAYEKSIDAQFRKTSIWNLITGLPSGFTLGERYFHTTLGVSILLGILFVIIIFILRFLGSLIYYYFRFKKKSKFAEVIELLNEAFSTVHWYRNLPMPPIGDVKLMKEYETKFVLTMQRVCDNLKSIFNRRTKSICAVSIKMSAAPDFLANDSEVKNICRDQKSIFRISELYKQKKHYVSGNTCFREITASLAHDTALHYYLNNNIPKSTNYQNSSSDTYDEGKLPYKSELVVPIKPLYKDSPNKAKAVGFLCLDSDKTNVFNNQDDLAILQGVADGIFDILLKKIKQYNSIDEQQEATPAQVMVPALGTNLAVSNQNSQLNPLTSLIDQYTTKQKTNQSRKSGSPRSKRQGKR